MFSVKMSQGCVSSAFFELPLAPLPRLTCACPRAKVESDFSLGTFNQNHPLLGQTDQVEIRTVQTGSPADALVTGKNNCTLSF